MTTAGSITGTETALHYEAVPNWGLLPHGFNFNGDATAVAVDSRDNVYVFNRGARPVMIFGPDGTFLESWGEGEFTGPHEITIDADDNVYLVDSGGHFIQKRTLDGAIQFTIGTPGEAADAHSGGTFNLPTAIAVHPTTRELFVSDGYRNSHVHRFSPDGEYIQSWGGPGSGPGEFNLPHGIAVLDNGHVIVCDRENFRLQIFTTDGEFVAQWHSHHPAAVHCSAAQGLTYVAELGPVWFQHGVPNLGNRVSILNSDGETVGYLGSRLAGFEPDQFTAPHSLAADSRGDIYIAEVSRSYLVGVLSQEAPIGENISLRKWRVL